MMKAISSMTSAPAAIRPGHFGAAHAAFGDQEFLDRVAQVVGPVKQHAVRFRQALPNMLGHAHARDAFSMAPLSSLCAQFFHGRDIELLVNTHDTAWDRDGDRR